MRPAVGPVRRARATARAGVVAVVAVAAVAAGLTSGCGATLQFVQDHRLHITAPRSLATLSAPVTVSWTTKDIGPSASRYGIYVDRSPVRPGQLVADSAPSSYITSVPSISLAQLPNVSGYGKTRIHEVTVVLVDRTGHRVGESAWYVDFRLRQTS